MNFIHIQISEHGTVNDQVTNSNVYIQHLT